MKKVGLIMVALVSFQMGFSQQLGQIQRGQRGYTPPIEYKDDTFIEMVEPYEELDKMMPKCIAELGLDAFQQELLKSMLLKKFESQNAILGDEKNTRQLRKRKIDQLEKDFIVELGTILSPEAVEKYKTLDFTESKEEKKKRKKKKKNKN